MQAEDFGDHQTIGAGVDGEITMGCVYYAHRRIGCEVALAADRPDWCTRGVLAALFAYPFLQLKYERIALLIGIDNPRALRLNFGLGFKQEGVIRRGYDGKRDAVLLGMLKDECKWIKNVHRDGW
jgi:RimJ/RimL family protein N-acetyltransferase